MRMQKLLSEVVWPVFFSYFFIERQRCGTAEIGLSERSERGTLPAVATTVLFGFFDFTVEGQPLSEARLS